MYKLKKAYRCGNRFPFPLPFPRPFPRPVPRPRPRNPYNRNQNPKKWDIWMRDHGYFGGWSDWGNRPHPSN